MDEELEKLPKKMAKEKKDKSGKTLYQTNAQENYEKAEPIANRKMRSWIKENVPQFSERIQKEKAEAKAKVANRPIPKWTGTDKEVALTILQYRSKELGKRARSEFELAQERGYSRAGKTAYTEQIEVDDAIIAVEGGKEGHRTRKEALTYAKKIYGATKHSALIKKLEDEGGNKKVLSALLNKKLGHKYFADEIKKVGKK